MNEEEKDEKGRVRLSPLVAGRLGGSCLEITGLYFQATYAPLLHVEPNLETCTALTDLRG